MISTLVNDVLWLTGLAWWLVVIGAALLSVVLTLRNRRHLKQIRNSWGKPSDLPFTDNPCQYGRSGPDVV